MVTIDIDCPITACSDHLAVSVDLVLGGPDVLPQRQVPDTQSKGITIPVRARLSADAVDLITTHLKQAHPEVDTTQLTGCTCADGPTRWGFGGSTSDTCFHCRGRITAG